MHNIIVTWRIAVSYTHLDVYKRQLQDTMYSVKLYLFSIYFVFWSLHRHSIFKRQININYCCSPNKGYVVIAEIVLHTWKQLLRSSVFRAAWLEQLFCMALFLQLLQLLFFEHISLSQKPLPGVLYCTTKTIAYLCNEYGYSKYLSSDLESDE